MAGARRAAPATLREWMVRAPTHEKPLLLALLLRRLLEAARDDAHLLIDRDGGLDSPRGQAARTCLYLFERDAAVGLLRGG